LGNSQSLKFPIVEKGIQDVVIKEVGFEKDYFYVDIFYEYHGIYSSTLSFDENNLYYIRDKQTKARYNILNSLPTKGNPLKVSNESRPTIRLKFEKIPTSVKNIDLIQGMKSNGWNFYGIDISDLYIAERSRIKTYSGFFIKKSGGDRIVSAFLNVAINGDNIEFEFDYFDEEKKRKFKKVRYNFSASPNKYPYKSIRHASNDQYWAIGGRYDQFENWLGKNLEFEYSDDGSEIHGKFTKDNNQFFLVETGEKMKMPKKGLLFTGTIKDGKPIGVGFYLGKNKDGVINHCIYSNYNEDFKYNGYTIYINDNGVYKGNTINSLFDNFYSIDYFSACYFEGYEHETIKWHVIQKSLPDIPSGAYGYNCEGKVAKKCDTNFKNCIQIIKEKEDYSLITALAGMVAIVTVGIAALASSSVANGSANLSNLIENSNDCGCVIESIKDRGFIIKNGFDNVRFKNNFDLNVKYENGKYKIVGMVFDDVFDTYEEFYQAMIDNCKRIKCIR